MTVAVQLDEHTIGIARRLAETRRCSLEDLIKQLLEHAVAEQPPCGSLAGLFADDPELMDEVVESAMMAREQRPLRRGGG